MNRRVAERSAGEGTELGVESAQATGSPAWSYLIARPVAALLLPASCGQFISQVPKPAASGSPSPADPSSTADAAHQSLVNMGG